MWLNDLWYRLKCRFWHKYNVVICKPLPATWIDRDELILYAAFQILEDYINKEKPAEFTSDVYAEYIEACDEKNARERDTDWKTIRVLYYWWQERKNLEDHNYFDDYDLDDKMLHRLIDIRKYLWT
jgi:hypothetical protein